MQFLVEEKVIRNEVLKRALYSHGIAHNIRTDIVSYEFQLASRVLTALSYVIHG
jgi:hypothetical protein